jgi:hypothetical protein
MKRKKVETKREFNILFSDTIKINYEDNKYLFEIGSEITYDLPEAISILLKSVKKNDPIWDLEIKDINLEEIDPKKCLYWLTGGKMEWEESNNYKKYWHDCLFDFQEEFGWSIIEIVKFAKTFGDIREGFLRNLNLPILYNFALSKNIA